jgi:DNA-binding NtrC family response regulator
VETFRDLSLVEDLRKELEGKHRFADIAGRSPAMRQVFQLLPLLADSESTVLIEGAIAGGMGSRAQQMIAEKGIQVILAAAAQNSEELTRAYLNGELAGGANACDAHRSGRRPWLGWRSGSWNGRRTPDWERHLN